MRHLFPRLKRSGHTSHRPSSKRAGADAYRFLDQTLKYIAIYRDSMEAVVEQAITRDAPVHLEGLGKEYGHFTALKALDLTVAQGTSLGFLGPNGAGKSTTIKIMTNLIRPSRGRASLFGIDVRREPTRAPARIRAVIETPEIYGDLSPVENHPHARPPPRSAAEGPQHPHGTVPQQG